jgi:ankyrin repeat protein
MTYDTSQGYTALIVAVEMGEDGNAMCKLLLEEGADPNALTLRYVYTHTIIDTIIHHIHTNLH